eukprot:PhM_4_TR12718/c0_g1_i1/m.36210
MSYIIHRGTHTFTITNIRDAKGIVYRGAVFIFGGRMCGLDVEVLSNRVFYMPCQTQTAGWTEVKAIGTPPCARSAHAVALVGSNSLLVHGGTDSLGRVLSDMHFLVLGEERRRWRHIGSVSDSVLMESNGDFVALGGSSVGPNSGRHDETSEDFPALSHHAAAHDDNRGVVFLHGGRTPSGSISTLLYEYDRGYNTMYSYETSIALYDHSLVSTPSHLILYGGKREGGTSNFSVYLSDVASSSWKVVAPDCAAPSADVLGYPLALDTRRYSVYCCGGKSVWRLDLLPRQQQQQQEEKWFVVRSTPHHTTVRPAVPDGYSATVLSPLGLFDVGGNEAYTFLFDDLHWTSRSVTPRINTIEPAIRALPQNLRVVNHIPSAKTSPAGGGSPMVPLTAPSSTWTKGITGTSLLQHHHRPAPPNSARAHLRTGKNTAKRFNRTLVASLSASHKTPQNLFMALDRAVRKSSDELDLRGCKIRSEEIVMLAWTLAGAQHIRRLNLSGLTLTDDQCTDLIRCVEECRNIESLVLDGITTVDDPNSRDVFITHIQMCARVNGRHNEAERTRRRERREEMEQQRALRTLQQQLMAEDRVRRERLGVELEHAGKAMTIALSESRSYVIACERFHRVTLFHACELGKREIQMVLQLVEAYRESCKDAQREESELRSALEKQEEGAMWDINVTATAARRFVEEIEQKRRQLQHILDSVAANEERRRGHIEHEANEAWTTLTVSIRRLSKSE